MTTDFYRFPAMAKLDEFTDEDQLAYIQGEVCEAFTQHEKWALTSVVTKNENLIKAERVLYGMELMDVIHSAETALRMVFQDNEIAYIQKEVLDKNFGKGYYDE